jgi:uncharacterized protein (DUF2267 family)
MMMSATSRKLVLAAAALMTAGGVLLGTTARGRRRVRRTAHRALGKTRYLSGHARGLWYRIVHGGPPEDVSDAVLVQRIRSKLGPLEKRLDVPRLHVSSRDRNVSLHGVPATAGDAQRLEDTVRATAGVRELASHVRVGFGPGDHRPSQGRGPSDMRRELHVAAQEIGADIPAVATVLSVFLHMLPGGERDHVLVHLPADVRKLLEPESPHGTGRIADEAALRDAVTASGTVPEQQADKLIRAVLTVLRRRVPEETSDIEAVLPAGLKPLWADPLGESPP